jgi:hypothetical protein
LGKAAGADRAESNGKDLPISAPATGRTDRLLITSLRFMAIS